MAVAYRGAECFDCRVPLPERVYRAHRDRVFVVWKYSEIGVVGDARVALCERCIPHSRAAAVIDWEWIAKDYGRCEYCAREVFEVIEHSDGRAYGRVPHPRHITCSERCRDRLRSARRAAAAAEERAGRTCEACGDPFTPRRADARYCSNACRQDAYRQRKAGRVSDGEPGF